LDKKKKSILNVFRVWDDTFFPATSDTGFGAGSRTAHNDAMAEALALLNAGEEEDEGEDEGEDERNEQGDEE
jgi:hypothetical protein